MTEIICSTLSCIASIIVAIIGVKINKTNKLMELRSARRKEESMLSLKMMVASMNLTEVCANALTGGHNNGNVEEAKRNVEEAREEYRNFQRRVVAEETMG